MDNTKEEVYRGLSHCETAPNMARDPVQSEVTGSRSLVFSESYGAWTTGTPGSAVPPPGGAAPGQGHGT